MLEAKKSLRANLNGPGIFFFAFPLIVSALSMLFFLQGDYNFVIMCLGTIAVLFVLSDINKYILPGFIASMFIVQYLYPAFKIQSINLVIFLFLFYYLANWNTSLFNSFSVPKGVKYTSFTLAFAVLLSLVRSPHFSFEAVVMTSLFFTYSVTGYLIFKYIKKKEDVKDFLDMFFLFTGISGVIIIIQIILTGTIRSMGLAGFAIIDFAAMSLVALLFLHLLLSKPTLKHKILFGLIFIILITTLSRFAWLGFILSLIYGVIISAKYTNNESDFLTKKFPMMFIAGLGLVGVMFVTGLHNIVIERFSDLNFSELLSQSDDKYLIQNSLETRFLIWIVAGNAFLQNIWTGIGYHMFHIVSEQYNILPDFLYGPIVEGLDAHTTFLNILVDLGVIGFLAYLSFVLSVFVYSFKSIKMSTNFDDKRVSIVLNILVFFIIVHSVYSGAFTFGQNAFSMYFIFGLTIVNYCILKNKYKPYD